MGRTASEYAYHGSRIDLGQVVRQGLRPQVTWPNLDGEEIRALWVTDEPWWASVHGGYVYRFPWPHDTRQTTKEGSYLTFHRIPPQRIEVRVERRRGPISRKPPALEWVPLLSFWEQIHRC